MDKEKREELIELLIDDIDNWDNEALRAYVDNFRPEELAKMSDEDLISECNDAMIEFEDD